MENDVKNLAGICGLYCGTCPFYLAFRQDDKDTIERLSREKGMAPEELCCDGCLSANVAAPCRDCRHGFRRCAAEKKVDRCFACADFPCRRLEDFKGEHVVNGISHHEHVIDNLRYMKTHGIEGWVKKQDKAVRCPQCGRVLYWYDRECPDCAQHVSG